MVDTDGNYVVTLADLQLPQALPTLTLIVTTLNGTLVTNPFLSAAGSANVTLTHGVTYRIFAAGLADATVSAGLFSASVAPAGGGSPVYSKVVPVGTVASIGSTALSAGGTYTLKLTDLALPTALTTVGAVAVVNGQVASQLTAAGTSAPFTGIAATYQVYAAATTAATGSYAVSIAPSGGAAVLSAARAVSAPGAAGPVAYSYDTTVATAGSYTLELSDFSFPRSFVSLTAVAVQGGAALGTPLTVPGTQTLNAGAGPLSVLVFAQSDAAGSLFGVDLTSGGGAAPVLAATQGVGLLFTVRQVSIAAAGNYAVNVSDVGFPAQLASFAVIVTSGSGHVGQIYGGGAFNFPATPGNYFINFIAQPNSTELAGTYALSVAPGPSVDLTSNVSTIGSGNTVRLKWTSQNATTCTASGGGWSGTLDPQGEQTSPAITTTTTFTLTCSGENASASDSVTVNVTSPPTQPSDSGGGGGALDVGFLLLLAGWVAGRSYIRHAP
jgi:hypothetical protein